jgi:hypothetical protein
MHLLIVVANNQYIVSASKTWMIQQYVPEISLAARQLSMLV